MLFKIYRTLKYLYRKSSIFSYFILLGSLQIYFYIIDYGEHRKFYIENYGVFSDDPPPSIHLYLGITMISLSFIVFIYHFTKHKVVKDPDLGIMFYFASFMFFLGWIFEKDTGLDIHLMVLSILFFVIGSLFLYYEFKKPSCLKKYSK